MDPEILIIAPDSYPPTTGESIVTMKFLAGLVKSGISFTVIHKSCVTDLYPPMEIPGFSLILPFIVDPVKTELSKRQSRGRLELLYWMWKAITAGSKIISSKKVNVIFSRSMPVFGHLPALILARKHHIYWIANWSDPAPLSISPPPFRTKKPILDLGKLLCKFVTRFADWHTFPNEYLKEYMVPYYPVIKGKSSVVSHIAFSSLYRETNYKSEVFRLCHIGSLWNRDPYPFFQAVKLFKDKNGPQKIEVLFVGKEEVGMEENIQKLDLLPEIKFIPPVSYDKSLEFIANCDVALVIEADTEKGIFFPSKVLDIIQQGKPMLSVSPKTGVMADLLVNETGGISVDRNKIDNILTGIETLYRAYLTKELQSKFSSKPLRQQFSDDKVITDFIHIISKKDE
jgi:hypothetical protein